jgi:nucleoside-triphosphatase THEP1
MHTLSDHLLKLAAVVYRSGEDDVDGLLAAFAADQIRAGHRLGGVVQQPAAGQNGARPGMQMLDLRTGRTISISQDLGPSAQSCTLSMAGLAEAAVAVTRAVAERVDLLVVNKFSRQEAEGKGLRAELASAVVAGLPVLTAVSHKCYDAWLDFTGGFGTTLVCERWIVDEWWGEMFRRESRKRTPAPAAGSLAGPTLASA